MNVQLFLGSFLLYLGNLRELDEFSALFENPPANLLNPFTNSMKPPGFRLFNEYADVLGSILLY